MSILIAVLTGIGVLLAGSLPWAGFGHISGLAALNLRVGSRVPWAIAPMALYLSVYWWFIGGGRGNSDDAAARRSNLRAKPLSGRLWVASLVAGALGFVTLLVLLAMAARLVRLPVSAAIVMAPQMPALTAFLLLAMQAVVAGVTEEAAFRGYMQSLIARTHGEGVAILVNGLFFGLLHFGNHPSDVLLMLPYYLAVSAVYGGLTWAADSILPALVLHAVGDVVVLTRWWLTGQPEWQLSSTVPTMVWTSGPDASFIATVLAGALLVAGTALAYARVHRLRLPLDALAIASRTSPPGA